MPVILAVAIGGAIGSVLRYLMNNAVMALVRTSFPLGIMSVNILGGFLMGVLLALFADQAQSPQWMRSFLMVGILGGFTTFSTFSADTVLLWQRGETVQAVVYMAGSVVLSIAALLAGMLLVRAAG